MSKEDGRRAEATMKEESMQMKEEAVEMNEESVKPIKEFIIKKEESMQMNDIGELKLAKDVEEMKAKVKELESKLNEVSHVCTFSLSARMVC